MDYAEIYQKYESLPPWVRNTTQKLLKKSKIENYLERFPGIEKKLEQAFTPALQEIRTTLKPYQDQKTYTKLPKKGLDHQKILETMTDINSQETSTWRDGYVSGAVYHGDTAHIDFLNQVYALNSQANPLHADLWPSSLKYESEVISMVAGFLKAPQPCGTLNSGGTESILLAMKAYRDQARLERGIKKPELVVPVSAHAAFDKACAYFNIKKVTIGVDSEYKANTKELKRTISRNTIAVAGSAPSFPHGVVDPIKDMSAYAMKRGIPFHCDACLGGFILPWLPKHLKAANQFDFSLPGVSSISVDTHKFGYAAKGSSILLYRDPKTRHYQYYTTATWPGGIYASPTFAGSRPGALSAQSWASMLTLGEDGYREASQKIIAAGKQLKQELKKIPDIHILGDPLWVIAFTTKKFDIYAVGEQMHRRGWSLNSLLNPACIHICLTLRHTQEGVITRFINDLKESCEWVKQNPQAVKDSAPIYGLAASLPFKGLIGSFLKRYLDLTLST